VSNFTDTDANDFHVIIDSVTCADIIGTYDPPDWVFTCVDLPGGGVVVSWRSLIDIVPVYDVRHFGVEFVGNPQFRVRAAFWTLDGRVLYPWISFVNQRWEESAECWVGDLVDGYPPMVEPTVIIEREFAWADIPIPLSELTREGTAWLDWQPGMGPEPIPNDPWYESPMEIPAPPWPIGGTLVRYDVIQPDNLLPAVLFTNEVLWDPGGIMMGMLSNFDVINLTDYCVDDFHISLRGVTCADIVDYYVPMGWIVECVDHPDGGGCDITWVVEIGTCVEPGEMVHFGIGLMGVPWFQVRAAYWTWAGVPIPPFVEFVNQVWWEGMLPFSTIDVVQGYDPIVDPTGMWMRRDFAFPEGPPIPLEELTWEDTAYLEWMPADLDWFMVPPDPSYSNEFRFEPWMTEGREALLIRYETWDNYENLQVRFTNEALISPSAPPPINDLRIRYIGMFIPDLMHFLLEWTPSQPIEQWYTIYQMTDPYDPATALPIGWTTDSFFDVFVPVENEPGHNQMMFYYVTADDELPSH